MKKLKKSTIKKILIFIFIYGLCFTYSFFFSTVYNDEIWNYGFSYNISTGLIPYKDFNLVTTPLYPMLASIFLKIFGSYLYSLHIFNSIILASIIYIFYDKLKFKSFIIMPLIFLNCYPEYNILSVLLILIIINLIDEKIKNKEYITGLLVGLMFLTKQTIGIVLFIPLIFYSKNKKKTLIGLLVPILLFFSYLIYNNALYEFIDYCFLGLLEFGNNNHILLFLPIEIIICTLILYKLFKNKFKDKKLFYVLMYQIITIPIVDDYHFMIGFIPVLYYYLLSKNILKYKIKYYIIISLFFFFCWNFRVHTFEKNNLYKDKDSYLYGRNIPIYVNLNQIASYIEEESNNYNHIYFFSKNAYYVKLSANYKLDKYDLINNGNMGYNGIYKYIKEIDKYCKNNSCMFILYKHEFKNKINQTNERIIKYVKKNYKKNKEVEWFDIYVNK